MFAEDQLCQKFLADETAKQKLATAIKLKDVDASEYDAVYYIGGQGPVIDLASDPVNTTLASEVNNLLLHQFNARLIAVQFYYAGKPTAAVCHGPACVVPAFVKTVIC
jgi:putative intracellular protease/amidase